VAHHVRGGEARVRAIPAEIAGQRTGDINSKVAASLEEVHVLGEVVENPLLVQEALSWRLQDLVHFGAVIRAHSELWHKHGGFEAIQIKNSVLIVVLRFESLDDQLWVGLKGFPKSQEGI